MDHTTGTDFCLLPPDARQLFMKLKNLKHHGEAAAPTRGTSAHCQTITDAITFLFQRPERIGYPDLQNYFHSIARYPF